MSISLVLITFLFQLSVGMQTTALILSPRTVDAHFFKSIAFWSTLFSAIALGLSSQASYHPPSWMALSDTMPLVNQFSYYFFAFLTFQLWGRLRFFRKRVYRPELVFIAVVGWASLIIDSLRFYPSSSWADSVLLPLHFLSAALLLGGFLTGMIFGHHYLMNLEMPKKLLLTMATFLIATLVFRILAVGVTLFLYKIVLRPEEPFLASLISFQGHGIFFWERILVGLAIPAVVAGMIWATARIGSNQSATGIMYVAVAFVFIGELVARYLFFLTGIPL